MAGFYMISWGIRQSYPSPLATLHGFRLCQWLPKSWTHGFFKGKPSLENPGFTLFCIFLGVSMDVWFKPHFSNAGFQKMLNPSESAQHRDVYGRKYEEVCRLRSIFLVFVHGSHIFSRWTAGRPWRILWAHYGAEKPSQNTDFTMQFTMQFMQDGAPQL